MLDERTSTYDQIWVKFSEMDAEHDTNEIYFSNIHD